jgi:glucokinase
VNGNGTVVFDIGGTWFRSAVFRADGRLDARDRRPAISFASEPACGVAELQRRLAEFLVADARRLLRQHAAAPRAVVSMGAALNAHTGYVFGSGPLWGPDSRPFDLLGALRREAPEIAWTVLNDVTAALLRHVHTLGPRTRGRTALVTISSGIACRVFDHARSCVPVDPRHGLQGEIGHLPVRCTFAGRAIEQRCDCGGPNHLAAFASGRGLAALLAHAAALPGAGFERSALAGETPPTVAQLARAARGGDAWSRSLVAAAMEPLASVLAVMLTHDPELDPILLVGGVAAALGDDLVDVVCGHLETHGLYQVLPREPRYFRDRIRLGHLDDDSGLLGCGIAAAAATRAEATA